MCISPIVGTIMNNNFISNNNIFVKWNMFGKITKRRNDLLTKNFIND